MAWIVESDGEICPFSIFDNMPIEMLAAAARSETDKSWLRRRRRTCAPIARSSVRSAGLGALEPVVYSFAFAAFVGERAFFLEATFVDLYSAPAGGPLASRAMACNRCRRLQLRNYCRG